MDSQLYYLRNVNYPFPNPYTACGENPSAPITGIYLEGNNLLNANQHGFWSKRSCLTQLLENYDTILNLVEEGTNVDVVYLDFAKAFDKVVHGILCHKLKQLIIGGKVGTWIHEFVNDRTQSITANGAT